VPGGSVWYQIIGGEAPGIPLLCLHGGPGMAHDYLEPLADLADERPVICYDQLGCGNSPAPDDPALWTVDRFVAEVAAVRERQGWTGCSSSGIPGEAGWRCSTCWTAGPALAGWC
jgi:proline iminopeptidase